MRSWSIVLSMSLVACTGGTIDDKDGSSGSDNTNDTEETDTEADTETDPPPVVASHVVKNAQLAKNTEGVDLDGDGTVDNAIGYFGFLINDSIEATLADSSTVAVLQLVGIDDFANDEAELGIFPAEDTDDDTSDNLAGSETFDGGSAVDNSGVAVSTAPITIADHKYTAELPSQTLTFGTYTLVAATPIYVVGEAYAPNNRGIIALGIDKDALKDELDKNGYSQYSGLIDTLADLDTDGDDEMDAVSAALSFGSTTCTITSGD
jgi:hypothetical protein